MIGDSTNHIAIVCNINLAMQNDMGVFRGNNSFLSRIGKLCISSFVPVFLVYFTQAYTKERRRGCVGQLKACDASLDSVIRMQR